MVALKILPGYLSDEHRLLRFHKEARAASGLNHPNIITIHEVGEAEDIRFIATEFIEGETLRQLICRKAVTLPLALSIAEQVCAALVAAHSAGIIHRDIKPENIMRRPDGIVKLLDFGIAKLTEVANTGGPLQTAQTELGMVIGTASYMSPEQARGISVDERSDIWSLGVVIYEMLTGCLPFAGATRLDMMVGIVERDPEPIAPGSSIQRILDKCLAKDPLARYSSASQLHADIKAARLESNALSMANPARREGRRSLFLLVVILALLGISSVLLYRRVTRSKLQAIVTVQSPKLYSEMTEEQRFAYIDEQVSRVSALMGERPPKLKTDALQVIKLNIDQYLTRAESTNSRQERLSTVFARAQPYLPTIGRAFKERNVPIILGVYLPMIESEYQVCLETELGAKGLFQFMPGTAAVYGVARDEMCDPQKMSTAAAHFLADRMAELGDDSKSLTLVLLSYTTGEEWVRSTLRELRNDGSYDRSFWTMFDKRKSLGPKFQKEIAGYVPRFFAAAIIGENPKTFGLSSEPLTQTAIKN
jgi:serine/threonine protein kinase